MLPLTNPSLSPHTPTPRKFFSGAAQTTFPISIGDTIVGGNSRSWLGGEQSFNGNSSSNNKVDDDYARRQRMKRESSSSSSSEEDRRRDNLLYLFVLFCLLVFYILLFRSYTAVQSSSILSSSSSSSSPASSSYHDGVAQPAPVIPPTRAAAGKGESKMKRKVQSSDTSTTTTTNTVVRDVNEVRRQAIKRAFQHAWKGYETYAYGHDEVRPLTNETNDSWGAMGVTMVDSLDTMLVMGLVSDFNKAVQHIRLNMKTDQDKTVSFFETTIRHLGGLLSAYDLSGEKVLLEKAKQIADRLLPAFDNSVGMPYHEVNLKTGEASNAKWTGDRFILSEVGSVQLEFQHLSYLTGNKIYAQKVDAAMDALVKAQKRISGGLIGLYPVYIDTDGSFSTTNSHITLGGLADSTYEYLLKQYLLSNKQNVKFLRLYLESVIGIQKHLLVKWNIPGTNKQLLFPTEKKDGYKNNKFEHLTCFVPGMLALGVQQLTDQEISAQSQGFSSEDRKYITRESMLGVAKELLETCLYLYRSQPTGIGPDTVSFDDERLTITEPKYLLRPETIESVYILYQVTGDDEYLERGWEIFKAIEKHCKTRSAYTGLTSVETGEQDNTMQSFFLAETLKYLYLLFSRKQLYPFNDWVLTTEAHLLKVHK